MGKRAPLVVLAVACAIAAPGVATAAPEPVVLESCSAQVIDDPGTPITLSPAAVEPPILAALAPLDPLGVTRTLFRPIWAALPPIPIGAVPMSGHTLIGGDVIADAVGTQLLDLPLLSPIAAPLVSRVWGVVAQTCGVLAGALGAGPDPTAAPTPPAGTRPPGAPPAPPAAPPTMTTAPTARPPAPAPLPPGGVPPETTTSRSNVALEYPVEWKSASSGLGVPPEGVIVQNPPAPVPRFGIAGADNPGIPPTDPGSANPLAATTTPTSPPGLLLLATLIATLVAAQLARRWALRRVAPAGAPRWRFQAPVVRRK